MLYLKNPQKINYRLPTYRFKVWKISDAQQINQGFWILSKLVSKPRRPLQFLPQKFKIMLLFLIYKKTSILKKLKYRIFFYKNNRKRFLNFTCLQLFHQRARVLRKRPKICFNQTLNKLNFSRINCYFTIPQFHFFSTFQNETACTNWAKSFECNSVYIRNVGKKPRGSPFRPKPAITVS